MSIENGKVSVAFSVFEEIDLSMGNKFSLKYKFDLIETMLVKVGGKDCFLRLLKAREDMTNDVHYIVSIQDSNARPQLKEQYRELQKAYRRLLELVRRYS